MPITVDQAIGQIYDAIDPKGKVNPGNALDALIGVVVTNAPALQSFLNELLKKKGVLSASDEATLNMLLAEQAAEKEQRQKIRTANAIIIGVIAIAAGGIIYFLVRKQAK